MAQVFGIPQYPVYSPLAGIADLYKAYKDVQRQEAQDAYAKEKDDRQFSIYDEQNKLKSQEIAGRNEQFLAEQAMQGLSIQERARVAEEENKLRYAPQDCNGVDKNTPACIQARQAGAGYAVQLKQLEMADPAYWANKKRELDTRMVQPGYQDNEADWLLSQQYTDALDPNAGLNRLRSIYGSFGATK